MEPFQSAEAPENVKTELVITMKRRGLRANSVKNCSTIIIPTVIRSKHVWEAVVFEFRSAEI